MCGKAPTFRKAQNNIEATPPSFRFSLKRNSFRSSRCKRTTIQTFTQQAIRQNLSEVKMRKLLPLLAVIGFLVHSGCNNAHNSESPVQSEDNAAQSKSIQSRIEGGGGGPKAVSTYSAPGTQSGALTTEKVSLTNTQGAESAQQAFDQKNIKNRDLQLEPKATTDAPKR